MQSHFNAHTLAEIYRDLFLNERTGVLALESEGVERRVYFHRGLIVFADSSADEDDLGRVLIAQGKISGGALEEARLNIQDPSELPGILLNRDLIGKEALDGTLQTLVRQIILATFRSQGGRAGFADVAEFPGMLESDVLATGQLILDGILGLPDFAPLADALAGVGRNLHMRPRPLLPVHKLSLSPSHGFIISRIDGSTSFSGVVSILPPSEEGGAARFLYGLLVLGVVEFQPAVGDGPFRVANILRDHADRQAMERMQERTIQQAFANADKDPYVILGVTPTSSPETIEQAYADAKAMFSRSRILQSVRENYRSHLAVIESKLIEAYLKLSQAEYGSEAAANRAERDEAEAVDTRGGDDLLVRVELDKTRSQLEFEKEGRIAESYYGKAKLAVRDGDFHNAIQFGKLAISHNDRDARYFMLLAECQARNPNERWQHFAEQNFARAVELDPWNIDYLLCLGRFYKQRGLKLRARKQFEKALARVPHHEEALLELATLD